MKLIKESNNARTEAPEAVKANDRSIVKSIRNTMIIGLPLTTVLSGVLAVGFAIALDGCSSKENKPVQTASTSYSQPAVAVSQPTPVASSTPEVVAKKKPVVRKPSTVIF